MEETIMSTKIDDLPIPNFEEKVQDKPEQVIQQKSIINENNIIKSSKPIEKVSLFKTITNEINEENVFLLVLFFLISISDINKYFVNIPFIGNYFEYESWSFILFKSVLFLIIFIIGKMYLLPKIAI
jgi:hypothetical protein